MKCIEILAVWRAIKRKNRHVHFSETGQVTEKQIGRAHLPLFCIQLTLSTLPRAATSFTRNFFVPISTTFLEYILISVAVNFVAILLYVTLQCSKLVYRNCKAARQAERIGKRFSMEQSLAQFGVLNRLKVDLAAANYEAVLETVAFRLATGHQVNSRMFQLFFTYVSLLFMMVFKNNQNIQ